MLGKEKGARLMLNPAFFLFISLALGKISIAKSGVFDYKSSEVKNSLQILSLLNCSKQNENLVFV